MQKLLSVTEGHSNVRTQLSASGKKFRPPMLRSIRFVTVLHPLLECVPFPINKFTNSRTQLIQTLFLFFSEGNSQLEKSLRSVSKNNELELLEFRGKDDSKGYLVVVPRTLINFNFEKINLKKNC